MSTISTKLILKKEHLIIRAIINDDFELAQSFRDQPLPLTDKKFGLTPWELANLLGREKIAKMIHPNIHHRIKIRLKGTDEIKKYGTEELPRILGFHYRSHLRFSCYQSLKKVIRHCPILLRLPYIGSHNRDLALKYKEELEAGHVADVFVNWIDDTFGYGLFADQDFPPNTYVGEYTGFVRRLYRFHPDHNPYCFHYPTCFWSWKLHIIDSLKEGNELRFLNHSNQPNLEPECLVKNGLCHLVMMTNRLIFKGEQLTFDYGLDYWRKKKPK